MINQVNRGGSPSGGGQRPSETRVARHMPALLALPAGPWCNSCCWPIVGPARGAGRLLAQLALPAGRLGNSRSWPMVGSPGCVGGSWVSLALPTVRWRDSRPGMIDRGGLRQRSNHRRATRAVSRSVADNAMIERSRLFQGLAVPNSDSREPQIK